MKPSCPLRRVVSRIGCGLVCLWLACGYVQDPTDFLIRNSPVYVPAAGGASAELMFHSLGGQTVLIALKAGSTRMQPYARLIGPDGSIQTAPPASSAVDGFNSAEVTLPSLGTYRLFVLDGAGRGGRVVVRVEVVP